MKDLLIIVLFSLMMVGACVWATKSPSTLGQQIGANLVQLEANMGAK